jgi:hypothetical protein
MKLVRSLSLCLLVLLGWATLVEAGGLFRRLPEVGEWAAFEWNVTNNSFQSGSPNGTLESHLTLTVKCVGEETIENRRHLWIEFYHELSNEFGTAGSIYKMLVPESVLVDGEASLDGVRGWRLRPGEEPLEFFAPDRDVAALGNLTLMLLGGGESSNSELGLRTIEVDGQEHVLTRSESGPLPQPDDEQNEDLTVTMEGTWWLSEDLAFGVAAAEITASAVNDELESETHLEIGFELIATGTGAVSELPDNN